MYDFKKFIDNKNALIQKMDCIEEKIQELDGMGIDVSEEIKKIESAKSIVLNDKISVVLVGEFSGGKTSVASGWINEKLDNMKIATDESSDEILCYTPTTIPEGCQIVDTPGLFGNKVGADENGSIMLLSDITKKYISEANLILYVVTAKNPIKDSHKECIRWILKDLNKMTSTIFVINRMDDVADLTDEDEYSSQARIKTKDLRGKLIECGLNQSEASKVNVACISAAPDGKDIERWNKYRDEYLRRSHLSVLEKLTNSILTNSREDLIAKTGCDILNDELAKVVDIICEQEKQISEIYLPEKKESLKRNQKDLDSLYKRLIRNRKDMKDKLKNLNNKKITAIRAASMEKFKEILEDEIGIAQDKNGYKLEDEINDILNEYAEKNMGLVKELGKKIQCEYDKQNDYVENLLKKGVSGFSGGLKAAGKIGVGRFKNGIFAGRELLGKIGVTVKFKPWQVTKMATFATKALPAIGGVIDIVSNIVENVSVEEKNRKFEQNKDELKNSINDTFYEIINMLNSDESYIREFAPDYKVLEDQIREDEKDIKYQEDMLKKFSIWNEEILSMDYRIY